VVDDAQRIVNQDLLAQVERARRRVLVAAHCVQHALEFVSIAFIGAFLPILALPVLSGR
jgi:hypothetical protein